MKMVQAQLRDRRQALWTNELISSPGRSACQGGFSGAVQSFLLGTWQNRSLLRGMIFLFQPRPSHFLPFLLLTLVVLHEVAPGCQDVGF